MKISISIIPLILLLQLIFHYSFAQYSDKKMKIQYMSVDSLEIILDTAGENETKIMILERLCWNYSTIDYEKAIRYGLECLELSKKLNHRIAEGILYSHLGIINCNKGSYDTSIYYHNKAIEIKKELGQMKGLSASLNNLGIVYDIRGDYLKAIKYYTKSNVIQKQLNDKKELASGYNNIGIVYDNKGDHEKALEYYLKALAINEEANDEKSIAANYSNLGTFFNIRKDYKNSIKYYKKALEIYEELDMQDGIGMIYNNLGVLYEYMKDLDLSMDFQVKGLKIREEMGDKQGIATSLHNIAGLYSKKSEYQKAKEYFKRALFIREKIGHKQGVASTLNSLGKLYSNLGEFEKAIEYNLKSLSISFEIANKMLITENYENLSTVSSMIKNYKKAYEYHQLYSDYRDSLFNEESNKQITEMQTKYESEKKEQQIKLLNKDNELKATQLAKKEEETKKQKTIIFSVIGILALAIAFAFVLYNRFRIIRRQKNLIQTQKAVVDEKNVIIEQKNRDITDSIKYAKRIQEAILTKSEYCKQILPQHFILFKPKDIVSGDFYWAYASKNNTAIWTVADCTGHGVPGAFMSMIGSSLLNEIIIEKGITTADIILNELKSHIIKALGQTGATGEARDGMDAALCIWYKDTNKLEFAGAYNPLYIINPNRKEWPKEAITFGEGLGGAEIKPDKQPIGYEEDKDAPFTKHEIQLQKGDTIYTFSDGYKDQFGGPNDKKFSYKRFRELLISIQDKSMQEQKEILDETIEKWRGEQEQIDDICIIGVRV